MALLPSAKEDTEMPSYDIEVTRDGRWWMVHIPAIDGLTQARFPGEIVEMARDYLSLSAPARPSLTSRFAFQVPRIEGHRVMRVERLPAGGCIGAGQLNSAVGVSSSDTPCDAIAGFPGPG